MSADWFAAIVAVCALFVSLYAVRRQDANADGQRAWEQDQITRRESFERKQMEEQNEWQKQRDRELREFEESLLVPKAHAGITLGITRQGDLTYPTIVTTLTNKGQPPIHLRNPEILLPNNKLLIPPMGWVQFQVSEQFQTSLPLGEPLTSGRSISAYWRKSWVIEGILSQLDQDENKIELRAQWGSEAGDVWISSPLTISLSNDDDE